MTEAVSMGTSWQGPAGEAYPLYFGTHPTVRLLWYVRLNGYHPVLEWFCAVLAVEGWHHVFSVAPIDPETYIETGFDHTKMESCAVVDADTLSFPLKGESVLGAEAVAHGLVWGMVNGTVVPDKYEQGKWNNEIERLKKMHAPA